MPLGTGGRGVGIPHRAADLEGVATGAAAVVVTRHRHSVGRRTRAPDTGRRRVVSMPCVEWFDEQEQAYRDQVLPPTVKARVAVEAGVAMPWYRFVGDHGEVVSLEHFGASADWQTLFREFGFTGEAVAGAARRSLGRIKP